MADGLGMIQDIFDAAGTLGLAVGRLELQRDVSLYEATQGRSADFHVISDLMNGETYGEVMKESMISSSRRMPKEIQLRQRGCSVNLL